jgi:hypothetical protein
MLGTVDTQRAVEAGHDSVAIKDVAALTPHQQEQAALLFSAAELAHQYGQFKVAAAHNDEELRETDVVRVALNAQRAVLNAHYNRAAHMADGLLIDADPDHPMPDAERARLAKLLKQTFGLSANAIRDLPADKLHEQLSALVLACEQNPDLKPLKLTKAIKPHVATLDKHVRAMQQETREDRDATRALEEARASLDVAHRAHISLVESVLIRAGKLDLIGRYILTRDATYQARRKANKPITEEPGAVDLLNELSPQPIAEAT